MRAQWLVTAALALVTGCSTATVDAIPSSTVPSSPAISVSVPATLSKVPVQSTTPPPSSVSLPAATPISHEFAGRLHFPPSTDWTEDYNTGKDMRLQYTKGRACGPGKCPTLVLSTEGSISWEESIQDGKLVSIGTCSKATQYGPPVRNESGDISVGDARVVRKGAYYESAPCSGTRIQHTWVFNYPDANQNTRGIMVHGFTTGDAAADFDLMTDYLQRSHW